ncbi:unnamed protein product [Caenorhabditis brenneri]
MHSHRSFLLFNAFLFFSNVQMAPCMMPQDCPCIHRGTFDSDWLQTHKPAIFNQYSQYEFSTPEVTYPECTAIIATCLPNAKIAYLYTNGTLSLDQVNPLVLDEIYCKDGHWLKTGFDWTDINGIDNNIKSTNISCYHKK